MINNYHSTHKIIFRLMMSKKAFVIEYCFTQILPDEINYHTFWALCLEQSSSRNLYHHICTLHHDFPARVIWHRLPDYLMTLIFDQFADKFSALCKINIFDTFKWIFFFSKYWNSLPVLPHHKNTIFLK